MIVSYIYIVIFSGMSWIEEDKKCYCNLFPGVLNGSFINGQTCSLHSDVAQIVGNVETFFFNFFSD